MKKEYTIQIGEVFTEEKAQELKEYLELKDKDILLARETAIKDILVFMDRKGWVYKQDLIKEFLTP